MDDHLKRFAKTNLNRILKIFLSNFLLTLVLEMILKSIFTQQFLPDGTLLYVTIPFWKIGFVSLSISSFICLSYYFFQKFIKNKTILWLLVSLLNIITFYYSNEFLFGSNSIFYNKFTLLIIPIFVLIFTFFWSPILPKTKFGIVISNFLLLLLFSVVSIAFELFYAFYSQSRYSDFTYLSPSNEGKFGFGTIRFQPLSIIANLLLSIFCVNFFEYLQKFYSINKTWILIAFIECALFIIINPAIIIYPEISTFLFNIYLFSILVILMFFWRVVAERRKSKLVE